MDQRLCYSDGPVGTGANIRPMAAPFCCNSWVVNPTADTLEHILDHAAKVAAGVGKLDVIPRTDSRNQYSPSTLNLGSYIFSQN